ncbi:transcription factor Ken [Anabrus simplex]|uniref:transcription factor Ken n=1 Tax=Anabrus simplex TaxID=316456 RepID=UPI0034DD96CE
MDITEAFRGEDISKTDFFDFVVAPDVGEHQQTLHFNRTLKSMGIFIENSNNNNNNNNEMNSFPEMKETNNNHLMMNTSSDNIGGSVANFDHPFWSSSACDKETVRLETAILEDLNKFCWSQESDASSSSTGPCQKSTGGGTNNTDGAIYTLTVLNGGDHSATWYRAPEGPPPPVNLKEGEETQKPHQQQQQPPQQPPPQPPSQQGSLSSPHSIECQSISSHNTSHPAHSTASTLDLDSILSIIPNQGQTTTTSHPFHPNGYHPANHHHHHHHHHHPSNTSTLSPHHIPMNRDSLLKNEQQQAYTYDDSGFVNSKDASLSHVVESPAMMDSSEASNFNNNNNDWKLTNNNSPNSTNSSSSSAESLLRSALQGKSFMGRYNGTQKAPKSLDGHVELRRVLSTPPGSHSGSKTPIESSPVFLSNADVDDCDKRHSPMMTVTMEGNTVVMFDDGGGGGRVIGMVESDNPSAGSSMDDILLSQLDAASYPEDYEKLKRIANEVAESVNQYCSMDHNGVQSPTHLGIYVSAPHLTSTDGGIGPNSLLSHHAASLSPILSATPPAAPKAKKYSKSKSSSNNGAKSSHSGHQLPSNGVRKERSLHYCTICSKGFKDKYSVNVHIRTHTGEKPFTCTLCGKSFRQKAHLAKHYQTHIAQKNGTNSNGVSKSSANKARFTNPKPS